MLDQWEPGELRGSRRVLRAAEGELPSVDSPVVFIPKYRKKAIFGQTRRELGEVLRRLAKQKESRIEEGHLMLDHVHMLISIPPKHAVSQVIGYIKGKSAIHIARRYSERKRNFVGQHFWARGYCVDGWTGRRSNPGIYTPSGR